MENKTKNELRHFAASNSGGGFKSYYGEVFGGESITRRYLIKGGPGTGKNTLMRQVAEILEGEGNCVEYYYCSSDAGSLDGIVINGKVAVLDATAPHAVEPELAGARDEIINLGALWSSEGLYLKSAEIKELSAKKSECYRRAYRFLASAESVSKAMRETGENYVNKEKLRCAVARIMKKYKSDGEYKYSVGICNSIGMSGCTHFDSYESLADTVYRVDDSLGTGSLFLSAVVSEALRRGMHIRVSFDPVAPEYPDAVMLTESKAAFVLTDSCKACEKAQDNIYKINMKRFEMPPNDKDGKREFKKAKAAVRSCRHLYDGLLTSAADALQDAGEHHFALEEIYKKEMNFSRVSEISEKIVKETRKILKKMEQNEN